jgi:hypothetical protein
MGLEQVGKGLKDPWRRYESTHEQQWREWKKMIARITAIFSERIHSLFEMTQKNEQLTRQKVLAILSHSLSPSLKHSTH